MIRNIAWMQNFKIMATLKIISVSFNDASQSALECTLKGKNIVNGG